MKPKDYEKALAEKLRYEFQPPAFRVVHDIKIVGKYSGGERQIDVAVFRIDEKYPFLVAEAKLYSNTIDILHVDAFITKIKEVNAQIGIMVVSSDYTDSERNLAEAFGIDLRIMTLEEALETEWLPIARNIFPLDWAFHSQIAAGLFRLQKREASDKVLEAIEEIPFDEWIALVEYAISNHPTEAGNFLWFIAQYHYDDGWRFNALQELIASNLVQGFNMKPILEHERNPEILNMLHEYGYTKNEES